MITTVTTALFASTGMPLWRFLVAAVFGLPKQLAGVYVGSSQGDDGCECLCLLLRVSAVLLAFDTESLSHSNLGDDHQGGGHCYCRMLYPRRTCLHPSSPGQRERSGHLQAAQDTVRDPSLPFKFPFHDLT